MKPFSFALILYCCVASLYGQNLARKVSFSYNRLALKLVLDDISADHDVYFVYSPDYIPTTQPITINVSNIAHPSNLDALHIIADRVHDAANFQAFYPTIVPPQ